LRANPHHTSTHRCLSSGRVARQPAAWPAPRALGMADHLQVGEYRRSRGKSPEVEPRGSGRAATAQTALPQPRPRPCTHLRLDVHGATTGFAVLIAGLWTGLTWVTTARRRSPSPGSRPPQSQSGSCSTDDRSSRHPSTTTRSAAILEHLDSIVDESVEQRRTRRDETLDILTSGIPQAPAERPPGDIAVRIRDSHGHRPRLRPTTQQPRASGSQAAPTSAPTRRPIHSTCRSPSPVPNSAPHRQASPKARQPSVDGVTPHWTAAISAPGPTEAHRGRPSSQSPPNDRGK